MADCLTGKRILVIEDEYFIAADLKRALTAAGAEVVGPTGGLEDGLDLLANGSIDAGVLDVNLEGNFSYAIADAMVQRDVPFLFVTGYDGWALPEQYRDTPRVAKPFTMQTVVHRIADLIGGQP